MAAHEESVKELVLDEITQSIGADAIATVQPKEVKAVDSRASATFDHAPTCRTQKPVPPTLKKGAASIMVGLDKECPRWKPGSVVRWAAWSSGYESQADADYAAEQLAIAAQIWNEADVGVTFEWVPLAKDATFVLVHGGDGGDTLAQAFFPGDNDMEVVYVFTLAFDSTWKEHMWRIFIHELGHVLGLRHEFAIEREGFGAVQLGPRNEKSVMNYRSDGPPELQQSDIDSTRRFYSLRKDANGRPPKVGLTEVKDYVPM